MISRVRRTREKYLTNTFVFSQLEGKLMLWHIQKYYQPVRVEMKMYIFIFSKNLWQTIIFVSAKMWRNFLYFWLKNQFFTNFSKIIFTPHSISQANQAVRHHFPLVIFSASGDFLNIIVWLLQVTRYGTI